YEKYLCRNDSSRKFTVTITGVTQRDSGSYLCGVHRNTGLDVFSAVIKRAADGEYSSISDSKNELYIFSPFCFQMQHSFTLWFSLCPLCCSYW
uniref:Immunoglobulin V-set domain-containing protein n=1 Tax=Dicentrarchus labrax TaxID=13489 RepID=A0A8P4KGL4_DICLA